MRTRIYIDGFNLYYGCLKNTPYKWLDLKVLCKYLLEEHHEIEKIKYFTARVKQTNRNKTAPQEQQSYVRALEHYIPEVSTYYGHFSRHTVRMENANPPPNTLEVVKTEEKGSDVNLAVHLLNDGWRDLFDCAIIISNDSDMAESMKLVREYHHEKVLGLFTPGQKTRTSEQLKRYAHFVRKIRKSVLQKSQLPESIPNTNIAKPSDWL